jgi:hypothetical protein
MQTTLLRLLIAAVGLLGLGVQDIVAGTALSDMNGKAPRYLELLICEADAVELQPYGRDKVRLVDPGWQLEMAGVLRSASYRARPPCLCISYPEVRFLKGGKVILMFTFHHGEILEITSAEVSGDYAIGRDASTALWDIVRQRIPAEATVVEVEKPHSDAKPEVKPVVSDPDARKLPVPSLPKPN